MPTVFTPRTLANRWECSERHVRNMIERGELPSFRLGGKLLRIRLDDVKEYECQSGGSTDTEGGSQSSSSKTENVTDIRSELTTRARLNGLRQRSMQS